MRKSILITGGARSGKSTWAEARVQSFGGDPIYIATAQPLDDEMRDRIKIHQDRRGPEWHTISEPLDLCAALRNSDGAGPRLVDCLTLWLSNQMFAENDWEAETKQLCTLIPQLSAPVVFVTNEVGAGIVPENALARAFRDAAGLVNQRVAETCDELWLAVAGHALKVKPT